MIEFMDRQSLLVYRLYNSDVALSFQTLAQSLGVSVNKVIRDIEELEFRLPIGWKIEYKDVDGLILIKPQDSTVKDLWESLNETNQHFQIIQYIVEENPESIEEISEEFGLSRATLYRRISEIKKWSARFNVSLETRTGVFFMGDEHCVRSMLLQFYDVTVVEALTSITTFDVRAFVQRLASIVQSKHIHINMGAARRLSLLMHIIHLRSKSPLKKSLGFSVSEEHRGLYVETALELREFFPWLLSANESEDEVLYLGYNILAEFRPKNKQEEISYIRKNFQDDKNAQIIHVFLNSFSDYFQKPLWMDDELVFELATLVQTIYLDAQLQSNSRSNYLLRYFYIYQDFELFKVIKETLMNIEIDPILRDPRFLELNMLEIFLMVKASILRQRTREKVKIIILTQYEYEKSYLKSTLLRVLPPNTEIRTGNSFYSAVLNFFSDYDLVLSTRYLHPRSIPHIPLLVISTIPSVQELDLVRNQVNDLLTHRMAINNESAQMILQLFNDHAVVTD